MQKKVIQKTDQISCLTLNTNIRHTAESARVFAKSQVKNSNSPDKLRASQDNSKGLFSQVLKRRRSRQSNDMFCNVDFDYAGDSARFQHLVSRRKDLGLPNKQQLDFECRLRQYKNINGFYASKPWMYPNVKEFSPHKHWE